MSNLPISSKYRSTPTAPVTEDERNQLSAQLNDAFTAGRLDQETYDQLLDRVFGAQQLGELVPVVEAVGKPVTHTDPELVRQDPAGRPGELEPVRAPSAGMTLAVVGGVVGALALIVLLLLALL